VTGLPTTRPSTTESGLMSSNVATGKRPPTTVDAITLPGACDRNRSRVEQRRLHRRCRTPWNQVAFVHGQLLCAAGPSRSRHVEEVLFVESPGHARCVHDDADTGETDARSDDVVSVGPESVEDDPPGEAASDEDSAVGGKDPPEV